eukprot:1455031-Rhodomonas_salina.5
MAIGIQPTHLQGQQGPSQRRSSCERLTREWPGQRRRRGLPGQPEPEGVTVIMIEHTPDASVTCEGGGEGKEGEQQGLGEGGLGRQLLALPQERRAIACHVTLVSLLIG